MMKNKLTLIPVRPETREKLKSLGRMGETYDDVINRLIENRILELVLPREPKTKKELERAARRADMEPYVPLEEVLEKLGL
jgi:predicted CopG family antitoxin